MLRASSRTAALPTEQARLAAQRVFAAGNAGRYAAAIKAADNALRYVGESRVSRALVAASLTLAAQLVCSLADWTERARHSMTLVQLGARYGFVYIQALVDDVEGQLSIKHRRT